MNHLCRAFTLIEILVVLGIIAVLIAVLFPTIRLIESSAQATLCASNLRQIGLGTTAYAADFRGVFLTSVEFSATGDTIFWPQRIRDFLTRSDDLRNGAEVENLFRCPENTVEEINLDNPSNYGKTPWSGISSRADFLTWFPPRKWSDFTSSSDTIFIGDSSDQRVFGGPAQNNRELCYWAQGNDFGLDFLHRDAVNILYADMHVARKTRSEVPLIKTGPTPSFYNVLGNDSGFPAWQPWPGVSFDPATNTCYGFNRTL